MGISIPRPHTSLICSCVSVCVVLDQIKLQVAHTPSLVTDLPDQDCVSVFTVQEGRAETPPSARGRRSGARGRSWLDPGTANGSMCAWDLDLYR